MGWHCDRLPQGKREVSLSFFKERSKDILDTELPDDLEQFKCCIFLDLINKLKDPGHLSQLHLSLADIQLASRVDK